MIDDVMLKCNFIDNAGVDGEYLRPNNRPLWYAIFELKRCSRSVIDMDTLSPISEIGRTPLIPPLLPLVIVIIIV